MSRLREAVWADGTRETDGTDATEVLDASRWSRANRELLAKVLTELAFEEVIQPHVLGEDEHRDAAPAGTITCRVELGPVELRYRARPCLLGHDRVDPASIEQRRADGSTFEPPDVAELLALVGPAMGMDPGTVANAVVELTNTLVADVHQLSSGRPVEALVDAEPIAIEAELRAHPWIVANKGRLGFDRDDYDAYAPERARPFAVRWLAVRRELADERAWPGLDNATVVTDQVGSAAWSRFTDHLAARKLGIDEVVVVPVHPWQWKERIATLHAGDLARGAMVALPDPGTRYRAQQSIRTLVDADRPDRRHLKLALSILNTSVYRGIPRDRAMAAPALSAWLCDLVAADPFLTEQGLVLLGEVASVSIGHPALGSIPDVPYQHTELFGAIWREPPKSHLEPGERAISLAALLHVDPHGSSFAAELIRRSGLTAPEWVDRLHDVSLPPLAHVLYRYGTAFSPHGQNCLLVLRDHVPTRLVVKDFVDDAMVSCDSLPELATIPDSARAALGGGLEGALLVQWLQGGLLVCVHRYLSEILDAAIGFPERTFWASAARSLRTYQERFERELGPRYDLFPLDAPAFVKLCLNRVRMFERGYDDHAERPVASAAGFIDNPLSWELGDG